MREWIGTLGTLGALGWAVTLYYLSLRDKKMDQARLLSVVPLEPEVASPGGTFELELDHGNVGGTGATEFIEIVPKGGIEFAVFRATKQLTIRRIEVVNKSPEVVSHLVALAGNGKGSSLGSSAQAVYLRAGDVHKFTFYMERDVNHWFSQDGEVQFVVKFTDNRGTRWSKTTGGPLDRLKRKEQKSGML